MGVYFSVSIASSFEEFEKPNPAYEWESEIHNKVEKYLVKHGFPTQTQDGRMPEPGNWFGDEITDHLYENSIKMLVEIDLNDNISPLLLFYTYHDEPFTKEIIDRQIGERENPYRSPPAS